MNIIKRDRGFDHTPVPFLFLIKLKQDNIKKKNATPPPASEGRNVKCAACRLIKRMYNRIYKNDICGKYGVKQRDIS